ncbi:hypothetical protein [Clostridium sp.]|uniref:hypothetical protein n=1 Tax=Clostridium sp. TaxID=1506 RepID=UPI002910FAFE|nr:hypothetical protein [Clostridium sp.]MDU5695313.1 hypothetical protein [Clostridium sp.]
MENKKIKRIRKRSEVYEMLRDKNIDEACIRFTAKPEKERIRDKILGVFLVACFMTIAIAGPNEVSRVAGIVMMFITSLTAFLA